MARLTAWDEITAADRYATRNLARMEASERDREQRSYAPVSVPPPGPPVPNMPPGYGMPGMGSWGQGMVWNGLASGAVSNEQAMRVSAVFGCWRILSDAVSTLPLDLFTTVNGARVPVKKPPYLSFELPMMGRIEYLCQVVLSLLTDGNAFVATPRDELGMITALFPLQPEMIEVHTTAGGKTFVFAGHEFSYLDIMHIPGMVMPGNNRGVSPIRAARDIIDAAEKAQSYGRAMIANHAVPPAIIEVPDSGGGDPEEDRKRAVKIAETWQETHGGANNAGKVGVLIGGAKLNSIALSPEDAQWLDSKRFSVSEIARIYGVPPHLLADASNSTSWGSGLAEQNLAFSQFSIRSLLERIEEGHTRTLTTHGLADAFMKLNLDANLRSSPKDRYETYTQGIAWHFLTPNEARELEDLPPLPGGDTWPDPAINAPSPKTPH